MADPYSLGEVNVDSLKETLLFLAGVYPFADETAKDMFTAHVNALDNAGNPNEAPAAPVTPAPEAPAEAPAEAETPAEDTTETTEETATATDPAGTAVSNTATANESNAAPVEPTADEKIAALEAQLADAKAAKEQGQG